MQGGDDLGDPAQGGLDPHGVAGLDDLRLSDIEDPAAGLGADHPRAHTGATSQGDLAEAVVPDLRGALTTDLDQHVTAQQRIPPLRALEPLGRVRRVQHRPHRQVVEVLDLEQPTTDHHIRRARQHVLRSEVPLVHTHHARRDHRHSGCVAEPLVYKGFRQCGAAPRRSVRRTSRCRARGRTRPGPAPSAPRPARWCRKADRSTSATHRECPGCTSSAARPCR